MALLLSACQLEPQPLPDLEVTEGRYLPTGPTGEAHDLTAPDTVIDAGPAAVTDLRSATFSFSSPSADVVAFQCILDLTVATPCQSPVTYTALAVGPHRFSVSAMDDAGNLDRTAASWLWEITGPPPPPDTTIDTVVPGLTNDGTFEIAFSSTGTHFECAIDGAGFLPCTSPFPVDVAEGEHTFAVRAVGDGTPASVMFVVDVTPPTAVVFGDDVAAGPQTFTLTCDDAPCTFECALDGGTFGACTSAGQIPGRHSVRVVARDAALNVSVEAHFSFLVISGDWLRVASGGETTCAISGVGRLYCWGDAPAPVDVAGVSAWRDVSVGDDRVCAVTRDGRLFCFAVDAAPAQVGGATDWYAVSVGATHQCAKKRNQLLYCWDSGQPTPVAGLGAVSAFAAGVDGTCAVVSGALFCFGDNTNNRLGLGIGNAGGSTPTDTGLADVTAVDLGDDHGCVISGGLARCFGNNTAPGFPLGDGEVVFGPRAVVTVEHPNGDPLSAVTALGVGGSSACAISGTMSCWGENDDYELGNDVTGTSAHSMPSASTVATFAIVAMGDDRACAITFAGELYCWGDPIAHPTPIAPLASNIDDDGTAYTLTWGTGTRAGERFVFVVKSGSEPTNETDGFVIEDPATSPVTLPFVQLVPGEYHLAVFRCATSCTQEHVTDIEPSLVQLMRAGGYAVFLRTASATVCADIPETATDWWNDVPGTPDWWTLSDPSEVCPTLRAAQIDAAGVAAAQSIATALSAAAVPVDHAFTAEHERAALTASFAGAASVTELVGLTAGGEYLAQTGSLPSGTLVDTVRCEVIRRQLRSQPTDNVLVVADIALAPASDDCALLNAIAAPAGAAIFKVDSDALEAFSDPETGTVSQRPTLRHIMTVAPAEWADALQE